MANQQTPTGNSKVEGELSTREADLIARVVEAMKKPYIDQDEVAKKERARQRLRDQRDESERQIEAIQSQCNHLRDDNTCRIAWQTQYWTAHKLYIEDGFCQLCNKHFHPWMKDGMEYYERMRRVPRGKAGLIS